MKKSLLFALFLITLHAHSQQLPACDSLQFNCCVFDSVAPNTVTFYVSNPSAVLFDYPAFVLFNSLGDTVAQEQVTYFGISNSPQIHSLTITGNLTLPFTGTLNLYTLFFDSLACSFPFTIADTTTGLHASAQPLFEIIPNPNNSHFRVNYVLSDNQPGFLFIADVTGRNLFQQYLPPFSHTQFMSLKGLFSGIYFCNINSANSRQVVKFVVQ